MSSRPPYVYITNKAGHNYRPAEQFGELKFLTSGQIDKYNVNSIYRILADELKDAQPDDYLLISSLTILNSIACSILTYKFKQVNFLLFKNGKYIERNLDITALL